MSVSQIIKGTINNLLNFEEQLYKDRIEICRKCKKIIMEKEVIQKTYLEKCTHKKK